MSKDSCRLTSRQYLELFADMLACSHEHPQICRACRDRGLRRDVARRMLAGDDYPVGDLVGTVNRFESNYAYEAERLSKEPSCRL